MFASATTPDTRHARRLMCGHGSGPNTVPLGTIHQQTDADMCPLLARLQILPASLAIDGAHVLENGQCFETLDGTTETAVACTVANATSGAPARGRLIESGW